MVVGMALAAPRPAEACHTGVGIVVALFGVAEVGINAPLTVLDVALTDPPRWYGAVETSLTVPTVLIGAVVASATLGTCDEGGAPYPNATRGERVFAFSMVGWSSLLLAHGIYTLARPRHHRRMPAIVPVPMTSDQGELLGFGIGGRF